MWQEWATPRRVWAFTATVGDTNKRTPNSGPNPFQVNAFYRAALWQLRCTAAPSGLITVNRVLIYTSLTSNGFPPVGSGVGDQHVACRWIGGQAFGTGLLRQPKGIDTQVAPITRRRFEHEPRFWLLEWNVNPAGDPGATKGFEVWAHFLGPEIAGQA